MKSTIAFHTFGCRLNQSETAVIERTFDSAQYKIVPMDEPADIVVINTCTVTENGDEDTRRLVNRICRINPNSSIALIGCQAQIQKEKLREFPNVHWIVGNAKKIDLRSIIEATSREDTLWTKIPMKAEVIAPSIPREDFTIPVAGIDSHHTRANIKIQDGCDFFCSFCEIPYARGRARSRVFDNILQEAKILVAAKHKELVLTGINLGTYKNKGNSFMDVISALEQIEGLERIRISSIEPTTIPTQLIEKMAGRTKLCRYLHIPLQSANDQILKNMKRKYTAKEFGDFIAWVATTVPQICIGTDVIVGFPGETEEQFNQTVDRLRQWPVHYFHVFSYSDRSMAKSRNLEEKIDQRTIRQCSQILRSLSQLKRRLFYESLIGTKQKVLFEQKKDDYWTGLTDNYVRVKVISSQVLLSFLPAIRTPVRELEKKSSITNQLYPVILKDIDGIQMQGVIDHA